VRVTVSLGRLGVKYNNVAPIDVVFSLRMKGDGYFRKNGEEEKERSI